MPLKACPRCNSRRTEDEAMGTFVGRYCADCNCFLGMAQHVGADPFVVPFGKYQGLMLDQVPTSYIVWATENLDLKSTVHSAFKLELNRRKNANS